MVAKLLCVEHENQPKLAVAKLIVQRLEEEIAKLKQVEIALYLADVRKILSEESSLALRTKVRQDQFLVILNIPPYQTKSRFINFCQLVHYVDSLKSMSRSGSLTKTIKLASVHWIARLELG